MSSPAVAVSRAMSAEKAQEGSSLSKPYYDPRYDQIFMPVVSTSKHGVIYALQPKQWECYRLTPLWPPVWRRSRQPDPDNPYVEPTYPEWIGFGGAAGGAKSHLARAVAMATAYAWPRSTSVIFRSTLDEVKENHIEKFHEEVPGELFSFRGGNRPEIRWRDPLNGKLTGSRTRFAYLSHEKDKYQHKGNEYDLIIFEESTHYTESQVLYLCHRLRTILPYSRPFALMPSNPGQRGHFWYKRVFVDRNYDSDRHEHAGGFAFVQSKVEDNRVLTRSDPLYVARLDRLPEPDRSWQKEGNFAAGAGLALHELNRGVHLVDFFLPPPHWPCWGAFDWGFDHLWSFGYYTANEDGIVFKCDTMTGRRDQVHQIASKIKEQLELRKLDRGRLGYVSAGHDAMAERTAYGNLERIDQRMRAAGLPLIKANIARIAGLQNLREYLAWQRQGPMRPREEWDREDIPEFAPGRPALYFMDTPGNRRTFRCLESRVTDPDNPEDVLKTNADEFGEGGDDEYDETRYAMASRPRRAMSVALDREVRAWDPEVLAHEADQKHKSDPNARRGRRKSKKEVHPEFGAL